MLGLRIDEMLALSGAAFLIVRWLAFLVRIIWWYLTDRLRVVSSELTLHLLGSLAFMAMSLGLISLATGWPARGALLVVYLAAAFICFHMGFICDLIVSIRLWRFSHWLMARRLSQYREQLLHGEEQVRLRAAKQLASISRYSRPARPELIANFEDPSPEVRAEAARAVLFSIPEQGDDDPAVLKSARSLLNDPALPVRVTAAAVLVACAAPPFELVPILCEGVGSSSSDTFLLASAALGQIGSPAAEPAIGCLRDSALRAEHRNDGAVDALEYLGAAAVPALAEIADRGDPERARQAARALGTLGEPARTALPVLRKLATRQEEAAVQSAAKKAIRKLGGDIG